MKEGDRIMISPLGPTIQDLNIRSFSIVLERTLISYICRGIQAIMDETQNLISPKLLRYISFLASAHYVTTRVAQQCLRGVSNLIYPILYKILIFRMNRWEFSRRFDQLNYISHNIFV